jgi:hypothetical protein
MKVLDLFCGSQHVFEGWFGSEADYQDQLARGLVQCPLCGNATITKRLSAPRLNLGAAAPVDSPAEKPPFAQSSNVPEPAAKHLVVTQNNKQEVVQAWVEMTKKILANTDDVGNQFAEEARRIHYGEAEERSIRGHASADERDALLDEGISVLPLLIPEAFKKPLQ